MYIIMYVYVRSPLCESVYISLCLRHCVIHFSVENSKFIFRACTIITNHTSMLSNSSPVHSVLSCGI